MNSKKDNRKNKKKAKNYNNFDDVQDNNIMENNNKISKESKENSDDENFNYNDVIKNKDNIKNIITNLSNNNKNENITKIEKEKEKPDNKVEEGFNFDKNDIPPCSLGNINIPELSSTMPILDKFKNRDIIKIEKNNTFQQEDNNLEEEEGFNFDKKEISPFSIGDMNILESSSLLPILKKYKNRVIVKVEKNNISKQEDKEEKKLEKSFNFDKKEISPCSIGDSNIPESSSNVQILEKYKNTEITNIKENNNIIPEKNIPKIINNKETIQIKNIKNIEENVNNHSPSNKDKIENNIKEEIPKASETSQESQNNKNDDNIFNFDKNIINDCINKNTQFLENSISFPIFTEYMSSCIKTSNSLIQPKIIFKQKEKLYSDLVFELYEKNIILPINKNIPSKKLNIKEENFDEIIKINNIIEGNKRINIFNKKENEIICQKPSINVKEKTDKDSNNEFQKILNNKAFLFQKNFLFDNTPIKQLNLHIDDKNDIDIFNFSPNNPFYESYFKKNIKSMNLYNYNDIEKKVNFNTDDEEEIENNSISALNIKKINKLKYTRSFQKSNIDKLKININTNILHSTFFNNINELYEKTYIKSFSIENERSSQNLNIDNEMDNIVTEIFYTFKYDDTYSSKVDFDETFMENSIEDIYIYYSDKNYKEIDLYNDYSNQNDIDVMDDIDLSGNYEQFKKYKNKRIKKKKNYLYSGDASIELMKTSFCNEQYNNSQTSLLHSLSTKLNEINDITNNEEIKDIMNTSKNLSQNHKNLRCTKKLMNELNRSLVNRYTFNSKNDIINLSNSQVITKNKSANSDILSTKSKINKDKFEKMMKKINKTNNDINKREKKMYINKIKAEQDNKLEKEIKKQRIFKFLYPIFFAIIPLTITLYNKFTQE